MTIELHPSFKKAYKKHIAPFPPLAKRTNNRINLFKSNPHYPLLRDHALIGPRRGQRAFSVTGDTRIVYCLISPNHALFLDIGTHNQVY
jgi:mRNA-degrading endonuclease YafQ of YafQ-DinJ toxin-antitoxin module